MRPLSRFAASAAVALLLPFPGPHVGYVPIIATLARRDALDADPAFFVIVGGALVVYTLAVFGLMSLVVYAARRR